MAQEAVGGGGERPELPVVRAQIRVLFIWNSGLPYSLTLVRAVLKPSEPRSNPMEPSRKAVSTTSFSNMYQCLQLSSESPSGFSMSLCSFLSVISSCSCLQRCFGIWSMSFLCCRQQAPKQKSNAISIYFFKLYLFSPSKNHTHFFLSLSSPSTGIGWSSFPLPGDPDEALTKMLNIKEAWSTQEGIIYCCSKRIWRIASTQWLLDITVLSSSSQQIVGFSSSSPSENLFDFFNFSHTPSGKVL